MTRVEPWGRRVGHPLTGEGDIGRRVVGVEDRYRRIPGITGPAPDTSVATTERVRKSARTQGAQAPCETCLLQPRRQAMFEKTVVGPDGSGQDEPQTATA